MNEYLMNEGREIFLFCSNYSNLFFLYFHYMYLPYEHVKCWLLFFLINRNNLEWLGRATNWAKFTATASLGVIHKVGVTCVGCVCKKKEKRVELWGQGYIGLYQVIAILLLIS